jgi:hypothetical protein
MHMLMQREQGVQWLRMVLLMLLRLMMVRVMLRVVFRVRVVGRL